MSILTKAAKPRKSATYRKGFLKRFDRLPEEMYGLELEVEGRHLAPPPPGWTAHNDGSLRGEASEYVLATPLNFEEASESLRNLFKEFKNNGTILNESNRTSFHVHVNMKTFNIVKTANLITLYGIFENLLTNWCGEYRVGNLFAQRMCDSSWIVSSAVAALKNNSFANLGNDWRYAAMNLASINKFGSIEFRAMRGITVVDDGITWLAMLNKLVEAANMYQTPSDIVQDFSGQELAMLRKIFGDDLARRLEEAAVNVGENVQQMLWKGVRVVQDVAYALDWMKVLDDLGQPYIPNPFEKEDPPVKTGRRAIFNPEPAPQEFDIRMVAVEDERIVREVAVEIAEEARAAQNAAQNAALQRFNAGEQRILRNRAGRR